jgi:hypothetical protein
MRDLVKQYLDAGVSRRESGKPFPAHSMTAASADSVAINSEVAVKSRDACSMCGMRV